MIERIPPRKRIPSNLVESAIIKGWLYCDVRVDNHKPVKPLPISRWVANEEEEHSMSRRGRVSWCLAVSCLLCLAYSHTACAQPAPKVALPESSLRLPESYGFYVVSSTGQLSRIKEMVRGDESFSIIVDKNVEFLYYGKEGKGAPLLSRVLPEKSDPLPLVEQRVSGQPEMRRFVPEVDLTPGTYYFGWPGPGVHGNLQLYHILVKGEGSNWIQVMFAEKPKPQRDICVNNLRVLDAAMEQAAMEGSWKTPLRISRGSPEEAAALRYVKGGEMPKCPSGGTYDWGSVPGDPTCTIDGHCR